MKCNETHSTNHPSPRHHRRPTNPLLSRGPRSQSKRPQRVRKWRKKQTKNTPECTVNTARGKEMESEMLLQAKGFKLTEGRMILRFVTATRPWQSPSPPPPAPAMVSVIESLDCASPFMPLVSIPLSTFLRPCSLGWLLFAWLFIWQSMLRFRAFQR